MFVCHHTKHQTTKDEKKEEEEEEEEEEVVVEGVTSIRGHFSPVRIEPLKSCL